MEVFLARGRYRSCTFNVKVHEKRRHPRRWLPNVQVHDNCDPFLGVLITPRWTRTYEMANFLNSQGVLLAVRLNSSQDKQRGCELYKGCSEHFLKVSENDVQIGECVVFRNRTTHVGALTDKSKKK